MSNCGCWFSLFILDMAFIIFYEFMQRCGLQKLIYLVEGDQNCLEAAESIKTAYVHN